MTNRKNIRELNHLALREPKNVNTLPSDSSGQEGDIVHLVNKNNMSVLEHHVKKNGKWYNLLTGRPSLDKQKVRRFVKSKLK